MCWEAETVTWFFFFERMFPSANMALIKDEFPVLVDTGFGSDWAETERLIREAGISPETLQLIVNTHYHSDHVGGNHQLQKNTVQRSPHINGRLI